MIRLYKEKKENIISDRMLLVMEQNFEGITGITRSVLSSIKKGKSRTKLCTIATFCISLKLGVLESLNLFELAGYKPPLLLVCRRGFILNHISRIFSLYL